MYLEMLMWKSKERSRLEIFMWHNQQRDGFKSGRMDG